MKSQAIKYRLSSREYLIGTFVLTILLVGLAAIYPNPYVANLNIPNSEDYFSIEGLKRIKAKIPVQAEPGQALQFDGELKQYLQNSLSDAKWIDKNITVALALTKTDTRDAVINSNEKRDPYHVEFLNINTISIDEKIAKESALWLADLICKIKYKEIIEGFLSTIRTENDIALLKIYSDFPALTKSVDQTQENIKILKDINKKYPDNTLEQPKLQLNISANENKDNLNNLSFITAYLPSLKQLSILEIQLAQMLDTKKRLSIEKEVAEAKRLAAEKGLQELETVRLVDMFQGKKLNYSFWPTVDFSKLTLMDPSEWVVDYVEETKNQLREIENINLSHFNHQMSQTNIMFIERKYDRRILLLMALMVGLFVPTVVVLIFSIIKGMIDYPSNNQ